MDEQHYKQTIGQGYSTLRESEKKVADFLLQSGQQVPTFNLKELAASIGTSEATVLRCIKGVGYKGYNDFKMSVVKDLSQEIRPEGELVDVQVVKGDDISGIPEKILNRTIRSLNDTVSMLKNEDYLEVIAMILKAKSIDIYGVGNSAVVALDLMNKLIRIGINCRTFSDSHVQHICACHLGKADLAIGISHSGATKDSVESLRIAKEAGAMTVAITNYKAEGMTRYADVSLLTGDYETTFYSETMVSRSAQLALVDMIYMGVLLSDYERFTKNLSKVNKNVSHKVL